MELKQSIKNKIEERLPNLLIIMRGLPGSGKSTISQLIRNNYVSSYFSTDLYWIDENGEYKFDIRLLSTAHKWCQQQVQDHINCNDPIIIVDNTNLATAEYMTYVKMINDTNYKLLIISVDVTTDTSNKRNQHNVPYDTILTMYKRWDSGTKNILDKAELRDNSVMISGE